MISEDNNKIRIRDAFMLAGAVVCGACAAFAYLRTNEALELSATASVLGVIIGAFSKIMDDGDFVEVCKKGGYGFLIGGCALLGGVAAFGAMAGATVGFAVGVPVEHLVNRIRPKRSSQNVSEALTL